MRGWHIVALLAAFGAHSQTLSAGPPDDATDTQIAKLAGGARVRITRNNPPEVLEGRVESVTDSAIGLRLGRKPRRTLELPLGSITKVERRHTSVGKGAALGLLIGSVGGTLLGGSICDGGDYPGLCSGLGAVFFGVVGTGVGAAVGATPRWSEVPLASSERRSISLGFAGPSTLRPSAGLRVALRF